jgi:pyruvate/2-oxoglutarate dehydrogenase complex dihydrolipoamide dehydrogenase (E3) component
VIEFLDRICATMDKELTDAFHKSLKKNLGFQFKLKTKVRALTSFSTSQVRDTWVGARPSPQGLEAFR